MDVKDDLTFCQFSGILALVTGILALVGLFYYWVGN
jgi:hypothetical protein